MLKLTQNEIFNIYYQHPFRTLIITTHYKSSVDDDGEGLEAVYCYIHRRLPTLRHSLS